MYTECTTIYNVLHKKHIILVCKEVQLRGSPYSHHGFSKMFDDSALVFCVQNRQVVPTHWQGPQLHKQSTHSSCSLTGEFELTFEPLSEFLEPSEDMRYDKSSASDDALALTSEIRSLISLMKRFMLLDAFESLISTLSVVPC